VDGVSVPQNATKPTRTGHRGLCVHDDTPCSGSIISVISITPVFQCHGVSNGQKSALYVLLLFVVLPSQNKLGEGLCAMMHMCGGCVLAHFCSAFGPPPRCERRWFPPPRGLLDDVQRNCAIIIIEQTSKQLKLKSKFMMTNEKGSVGGFIVAATVECWSFHKNTSRNTKRPLHDKGKKRRRHAWPSSGALLGRRRYESKVASRAPFCVTICRCRRSLPSSFVRIITQCRRVMSYLEESNLCLN
jgi:hypothetical protein